MISNKSNITTFAGVSRGLTTTELDTNFNEVKNAISDIAILEDRLNTFPDANIYPGMFTFYYDFERNNLLVPDQFGFQKKSIAELFSTTRASGASYRTNSGVATVGNNTPRIDFNATTRQCDGLLVEPSRVNYLLHSETFSDAVWITTGTFSRAQNVEYAPDGTLTADQFTDNEPGAVGLIHQVSSVSSIVGKHTGSIYVKKGTLDTVTLNVYRVGQGELNTHFTFSSGTTMTMGGDTLTSGWEYIGQGWFRIWQVYDSDAAGGTILFRLWTGQRGVTNVTGTVFVWGAQLERGASMTSYIKTTTAAVTRSNEEVRSVDYVPLREEGSMFVWAKSTSKGAGSFTVTVVNDSNNYLGFQYTGGSGTYSGTTYATVGGVPYGQNSVLPSSLDGDFVKSLVTWRKGEIVSYHNGVKYSHVADFPGFTRSINYALRLGGRDGSTLDAIANIKRVWMLPFVLSEAEAIKVTS